MALVIADDRRDVAGRIEALQRRGYCVRFFDKPWDALGVFADQWPETAFIGTVRSRTCLDLLIGDLERYGVPYIRSSAASPAPSSRKRMPAIVGIGVAADQRAARRF